MKRPTDTAGDDGTTGETTPGAAPASIPHTLSVEGRAHGRTMPAWLKFVLGLTGITLLISLGALFARFVLGYRRMAVLEVTDGRAEMRVTTRLAGREIRSAVERFPRNQVLSVSHEVRYPFLLTLFGLLCLGAGVIVGILLILDGVQGEFTGWILSGVGILIAGVIIDLVLSTIAPSLPGQHALVVRLPGNRALRLVGCASQDAQTIVRWASGPHPSS